MNINGQCCLNMPMSCAVATSKQCAVRVVRYGHGYLVRCHDLGCTLLKWLPPGMSKLGARPINTLQRAKTMGTVPNKTIMWKAKSTRWNEKSMPEHVSTVMRKQHEGECSSNAAAKSVRAETCAKCLHQVLDSPVLPIPVLLRAAKTWEAGSRNNVAKLGGSRVPPPPQLLPVRLQAQLLPQWLHLLP